MGLQIGKKCDWRRTYVRGDRVGLGLSDDKTWLKTHVRDGRVGFRLSDGGEKKVTAERNGYGHRLLEASTTQVDGFLAECLNLEK